MKKLLWTLFVLLCFSNLSAQHTIHVQYKYYSSEFDTVLKGEILTCYLQTVEHAKAAGIKRTTVAAFHYDSSLPARYQFSDFDKEYSAWNTDPKNKDNQYDRGHVVPYESQAFNEEAAKASMSRTNTMPQSKSFNEKVWRMVETIPLDSLAKKGVEVEVWTGVLVNDKSKKMGKMYIPDFYWKVISYGGTKKAWCGINDATNKLTKPISISISLPDIKAKLLQYYPKLKLPF